MTDDTKHKIGDKSAQPGDGAHKLDNPETKELVNAGGTAMRGIENTRTNKSSGSFDESQEMSIEIDFGNGHRESRRNKGAGETGQPTETAKPSSEQLKHENLGALIPLAQVADIKAFPVLQSHPDHADVSKFPQPQPLPFRPELKPLPIPILPKDGPSPILHPPHPETAAKASLEPPLPRPNGPVYVDRTVPSPLLHQSHTHEAARVEAAAAQTVVPRGADSGVIEGARDLPLSPKDQPIPRYSPETHDKNGFVKDPVGYGMMLAQQAKPGTVRTDAAPPPAPVPHLVKPTQAQTPLPAPVSAPISQSAKPVFVPAPVLPVTHKDTLVSPEVHPAQTPPPVDYAELARKTREQSETRLKEKQDAEDTLNQSRRTLEVNARAVITNKTECDQFLADMRDFEKGYVERTPLDRAKALVEIAETYKQVDRLLTATRDAIPHTKESAQKPGDTPWRVQIAEQIMHHAAVPTSVDQGVLAVCSTSSLQVRQYYREPQSVAKLVVDVALTGKYTARTGDKSIEEGRYLYNLVPDPFARLYNIQNSIDGKSVPLWTSNYIAVRSFASQIYDVTAVDLAVSGKGYRYRLPTPAEIKQSRNNAQGGVVDKFGEFIPWNKALGKIAPNSEDLVKLNRWITGKYEPGFVVAGSRGVSQSEPPLVRELFALHTKMLDSVSLTSSLDLSRVLREIKDRNQFPAIVLLDASMPPISSHGSGGHYVNVMDISDDGSWLSFDNTWGQSADHTSSLSTPTLEIGQSCLSNQLITFDWVANNQPHINGFSGLNDLNTLKFELQAMSTRLSRDGKIVNASDCEVVRSHFIVETWLKSHPWDQKLVEFQRRVDGFLQKFPLMK